MVPEVFTFEIALYLGRIKKGPKPYDDDLFAALIHDNATNGFGFRSLKSMVKNEGYSDFWGTDKMMPKTGTQGSHTREEMEEAFAKLHKKLQGNPEVVTDRYVTFLEFAELCFKKKIFKKESNLKIVQKAINLKMTDESKKAMMDKARNESLAISPELAASYGQGELQLMNVTSQEVGAEVEIPGIEDARPRDAGTLVKMTKISKTSQTLELAEIDELILKEFQVEDVSNLESNLLKYREKALKLQKDNLQLMKTNDFQAKQLCLEKKATVDNVEEMMEIKMKPVFETLEQLPRKIKLMIEEMFKKERLLNEAKMAEKEVSDKEETKTKNERDSIAEHTQDMVREIYEYLKPVDVSAFGNFEEPPVESLGELLEGNFLVETTLDEVIVLDDEKQNDVNGDDETKVAKETEELKEAGEEIVQEVLEKEVGPDVDQNAEIKVGRQISVVINKSRKGSKSAKKGLKNVSFHNGERMFGDYETPGRSNMKTPDVPKKTSSRWSRDTISTPTTVEDNKKKELVDEQKKREVREGLRKDRAKMLEAQRLEAKRKIERELRDAQRRKMDKQEVLRKKERDILEAEERKKALTENRMRKEMELFASEKKEKEVTETRKRMAREVEEARRKEALVMEERTRDVMRARGEQGLSRDGKWKELGEESRTVSFSQGEGRERSRERFREGEGEVSRERFREGEGSRERFRERRGNSPRARRSLGEKFRRCQGFVAYFNFFLS